MITKYLLVRIDTNGRDEIDVDITELLKAPMFNDLGEKRIFNYTDNVQGMNNIQILCNAIREVFYRYMINTQQDILRRDIPKVKKAKKRP